MCGVPGGMRDLGKVPIKSPSRELKPTTITRVDRSIERSFDESGPNSKSGDRHHPLSSVVGYDGCICNAAIVFLVIDEAKVKAPFAGRLVEVNTEYRGYDTSE
jgi:hypothetical protein